MTGVRESAKYIFENADDVSIDLDACQRAAASIYASMLEKSYSTETWSSHVLNPDSKEPATVDWIFVVDLLNFSFWSDVDDKDTGRSDTQRFTVSWLGQQWTGYWSLCAAINRALAEGIPITTPAFWIDKEKCSDDVIRHIFRSETAEQVPMLKERIACLREAGEALTTRFGGSFVGCIAEANESAVELVKLIVDNFPCFRDESEYKGRTVKIYKRAQILVSDIWACFNQQSYGKFTDIDEITMFADYRVPQILHSLGCLKYSDSLTSHVQSLQPIPHNDPREVELRGCSIWSVELIKEEIMKQHPGTKINAILIDFYLWDTAKEIQNEMGEKQEAIQCHRTRSVFY
ncbi:hypothetical protein BZA70DRAFT_280889 [Myxozyma melibiosi]|uniref:Queuosine 5'-phosphate N-glycosylase/hydrolase n=1 Tax=Myxozyma melibiosi TaxID=54550 RepID=A0ABR1F3V9_9ASCO